MIKAVALESAGGGNASRSATGIDGQERVSTGKADALCAIALCILTLLSWIPRWNGPLDYRWDAGTYYILGTSLAEGKGYRLLNEPGEIRADQYPPLLPLIVAAHEKLLSSSDIVRVGIALRRTWILLSLIYVCGAFFLARTFFSRIYSFWLAMICMLSYVMVFLSTLCFAELPFGVATVFFAWTYLRKNGRSWTRYLTPAFAIAGYLLRSMGIALLAAWVADALFRRHFRAAAVRALIALTPIVAWLSYVHIVESAPDYKRPYYAYQRDPSMFYNVSYAVNMQLKDPFKPDLGKLTLRDLVLRFTQNAIAIPTALGESITAREGFFETHVNTINRVLKKRVVPAWPFKVLLYCLGLLVLLGVLNLALKRQWLVASAVLLTVAAICSTPWPGQFSRYLAPIVPLLLLAFLTAFEGLPETAIRVLPTLITRNLKPIRVMIMAFAFCETCFALQSGLRNFLSTTHYKDASGRERSYNIMHSSGEYADTDEILRWLGSRADRRSVIAVTMPQWVYIRSGFKAIIPPLNTNADKVQKLVDTVPVSFVIVEDLLMSDNFNTYFPKVVESSPDRWKLIYSIQGSPVKLYARVGVARLSGEVVTR
ncbi:MAG: hypothetical protein ACJ74Y_15065 [Bryobacteraceae bacterium]